MPEQDRAFELWLLTSGVLQPTTLSDLQGGVKLRLNLMFLGMGSRNLRFPAGNLDEINRQMFLQAKPVRINYDRSIH